MIENQPNIVTPQYHQSSIDTFLKCGLKYQFQYIEKIRMPAPHYFTVGRAVDAGINVNLSQKIESKTDLPVGDVLDAVASEFDREAKETVWTDIDQGAEKDTAIACAKILHEQVAPKIQPATVQEKFVLQTDAGYALGGTMDVTTVDDWVRDTKTANKKNSYGIHGELQPAMYDFAFEALRGRRSNGFGFDTAIKTKVPQVQITEARVTAEDRAWFFQTVAAVHKAIQAGVFLPASSKAWWCSAGQCQFWSMCKGKKT